MRKTIKYSNDKKKSLVQKSCGIGVYYDEFCNEYYCYGMGGVPKGTHVFYRTKINTIYNCRYGKFQ